MTDEENKLIKDRRRKLSLLREQGQAYPNGFRRDALAADLHARFEHADNESLESEAHSVTIAGRIMAKRVMGKASFIQLQDVSGRIQAFVQRDALPEGHYTAFKTWDVGDIAGVRGELFRTRTGELTVKASSIELLTKSLRPLPEKYHGLSDQEIRYRQRYVDLIMNADSREVFLSRTRMIAFMRQYLTERDFLEVETPMMQPLAGGANARPFVTHHNALDMELFLRVAPELYLKRLVVGGLERVFEINRNFRNEGLSTRHNPEFTMLELYQAFAECEDIMQLTEGLIRGIAEQVFGGTQITYQGDSYDLGKPFERLSVEKAVAQYNPEIDAERLRDADYLRGYCEKLGIKAGSGGAGKLLMDLFDKTVEHHLVQPTFIMLYPVEVSPLSRASDNDAFVADRFELFIGGREIANGFSELNDPEEQAARFRAQAEAKAGGDDEAMFFDADYVRALEYGLPPTGGLGVGVDRLAMFFTDSPSIRDVLLFPHMRPEAGES